MSEHLCSHYSGVTTSKDDIRLYRLGENAYKDTPFAYIAIGELA